MHAPPFRSPPSVFASEVTTASVGVGRDLLVDRFVNQLGYLLTRELDMVHLSSRGAKRAAVPSERPLLRDRPVFARVIAGAEAVPDLVSTIT
ncbi:MAG: hypothetical protein J4F34_09250 [Gemmatimonadetes bacterium]|nr:hypothetical protein [Gemmatimonadota bacterium]